MVRHFLLSALLLGAPVHALTLRLQPWQASCLDRGADLALDCGIPQPVASPSHEHVVPHSQLLPGDAHKAPTVSGTFNTGGPVAWRYELRIYQAQPKMGPGYYNVQLEWINPVRGMCTISVDASKAVWPPVNCTTYDAKTGVRYGLLIQTL